MKKILLVMMFIGFSLLTIAQSGRKGDLQIGAQGGISIPVGEFKTYGDTKIGYSTGFFVDKYFNGDRFGLGVDVRYQSNSINKMESFVFDNGYIETVYNGKLKFDGYLFTVGPSYKYSKERFQLELYAKGGMMMRYFPEYVQSITYTDALNPSLTVPLKYTTNATSNQANAWAAVAGLRFNHKVTKNIAVFTFADYVQTFGKKFGNKSSLFFTEEILPIPTNPINELTYVKDYKDHYGDTKLIKGVHHQSFQVGLGVKYILNSGNQTRKSANRAETHYDDLKEGMSQNKDLQIVVKDKQTNLSLGGVTVSIESMSRDEKSITDVYGRASKVTNISPEDYIIYGEKNGIKTPILTLTAADFETNSTELFRELFHDDPRFTLIGETFDCAIERNLSNINTMLTNAENNKSIMQTSDREGKFIYQLDPQSDFTVMANHAGLYSQTELLSTKGLNRSQTLYVTLKLGVCALEKNGSWVLKNILYDFDKSTIRPDAALVLDNLVAVMKENPSLRIELSSHTDSRGNDDYNMKLSQRRADAAVNYLVRNGVQQSRVVARGYGESKLINNCGNGIDCSEMQHQENRRTEVRILEYNN